MKIKTYHTFIITAALAAMLALPNRGDAEVTGDYLYNLSSLAGDLSCNWVKLFCDRQSNEVYVLNTSDRSVSIFNGDGMEIYTFGDDDALGNFFDLAVMEDGRILLLANMKGKNVIVVCNFRGEAISKIELSGLPPELAGHFMPAAMRYSAGHLYLADTGGMRVVVAGMDGRYERSYDLAALIGIDENKRQDNGIRGFNVGKDGDILFTVPTQFSAYVLSPDGKLAAFGTHGSAPGKFNIVAGITSDDNGNIYVTDTLRSVVMVFDKNLHFQNEFGYRGFDPGNLIAPMDLAVDGSGKVYVAQSRSRGVSVFRVTMTDSGAVKNEKEVAAR